MMKENVSIPIAVTALIFTIIIGALQISIAEKQLILQLKVSNNVENISNKINFFSVEQGDFTRSNCVPAKLGPETNFVKIEWAMCFGDNYKNIASGIFLPQPVIYKDDIICVYEPKNNGNKFNNNNIFLINKKTKDIRIIETDGIIRSSPIVVSDTMIYFTYQRTTQILHCYDLKNMSHKWQKKINNNNYYSCIIYDNILVYSTNVALYGVDISTGKEEWVFNKINNVYALSYKNHIIFGLNINPNESVNLFAMSTDSRNIIWNKSMPNKYKSENMTHPVVVNYQEKVFVIITMDSKLYCYNAYDGNEIHNENINSTAVKTPAFSNGKILTGRNILYNIETGHQSKQNIIDDADENVQPVIYGDKIIYANNNNITCYDLTNFKKKWTLTKQDLKGLVSEDQANWQFFRNTKPVIMDKSIYIQCYNSILKIVDK